MGLLSKNFNKNLYYVIFCGCEWRSEDSLQDLVSPIVQGLEIEFRLLGLVASAILPALRALFNLLEIWK